MKGVSVLTDRRVTMEHTSNFNLKPNYIHFISKWLISIGSALIVSFSSSYVNASSPKTISFVLDNDILVPSSRDQDYAGGLNVSYLLRAHSSEVRNGIGDRNLIWGGTFPKQKLLLNIFVKLNRK